MTALNRVPSLMVRAGTASALTIAAVGGSIVVPGVASDASAATMATKALQIAASKKGSPYKWGASGPRRFDCSGLTQRAWAQTGKAIGRTTYDQLRDGTETTVAQLQPGDLVLIPGSQGTLASPGHMGMYVGSGLVVHAPRSFRR